MVPYLNGPDLRTEPKNLRMGKWLKMIEGIIETDSFWSYKITNIMRKIGKILLNFYNYCFLFGGSVTVKMKILK